MAHVLKGEARYLLHERLADGGEGIVHRATMVTPLGERSVVVKRLAKGGAVTAEETARIVAEAKLVYRLTHVNICQVLDLGESDEGTFIVMEHVRGLDLATLLERMAGERLDIASAVYVAREVALALDHAHRRTDEAGRPLVVVHGDVTPRNVLVSTEGEVKLTDFGIARALGTAAPGNAIRAGTPGYLAPEWGSPGVSHQADVYSLGMTLYAALLGTGRPLGDPRRLKEERPEVSEALAAIVERATATRPEQRHLSAGDLARELTLELARRHPAHTPKVLGDLVRDRAEPGLTPTTAKVNDAPPMLSRPDRPAAGEANGFAEPATSTRTLAPPRRTPRRWVAVALPILIVVAGAGWALRRFSAQPVEVAASSNPSALPAATPTPAPPPVSPEVDPPSVPVAQRLAPPAKRSVAPTFGYLTVTADPWGALFVDGKRLAEGTPVYKLRLPTGDHRVTVFYPDRGAHSPVRHVSIEPDKVRVIGFHP